MELHYCFNGEDCDYDVPDEQANGIGISAMALEYSISEELAEKLVSDFEIDVAECYRDDIEEFFESDARDDYEDAKEYQKDPYKYYGVKPSDFF